MTVPKNLTIFGTFAIILATLSCQTKVESQQVTPTLNANKAPSAYASPTVLPALTYKVDSITDIDFKNFTFPWTKDQGSPELFTLKDGKKGRISDDDTEATLQKIEYGDVTNDGKKEAMISIYPWSGGNCQCEMVYIYTLKDGKPLLLWSFDTWDRAIGGFKKAYSEKGILIIELFGDDKFENDEWEFDSPEGKFSGYCCPTAFTRIRFHWYGSKFVPTGKREIFDYDWNKRTKENE